MFHLVCQENIDDFRLRPCDVLRRWYDAVSSRQEWLVRLLLCWDLSEDCHSNSDIHTFWGLSTCLCFVQSWGTPAVYGAYSMTCVWTRLIRYILRSLGWTDIYALFVLFCALILLWKGAYHLYNVFIRYSKWYWFECSTILSPSFFELVSMARTTWSVVSRNTRV
jgi:hypothetical protein